MAMHADHFGGIGKWVLGLGFMGVIATFFSWWSDVINEAHAGDHTPVVQLHLRYGMTLRSEEHTSELQSLMRISYAVLCLQLQSTNKNASPNTPSKKKHRACTHLLTKHTDKSRRTKKRT